MMARPFNPFSALLSEVMPHFGVQMPTPQEPGPPRCVCGKALNPQGCTFHRADDRQVCRDCFRADLHTPSEGF